MRVLLAVAVALMMFSTADACNRRVAVYAAPVYAVQVAAPCCVETTLPSAEVEVAVCAEAPVYAVQARALTCGQMRRMERRQRVADRRAERAAIRAARYTVVLTTACCQ